VSIPDLFWLLLPVAAVAGWFAAKRSDARSKKAFWDYSSDFHQGLNVLLSDQREKPVELFNSGTGADRNTAETHIALGNHYRQRGDMERAVFMHESVINKPELDDDIRAEARLALALDYDSAGLLDRSEDVLKELILSGHHESEAYRNLLQIHERQGDWQKAIKIALEASSNNVGELGARVAHYHCELALLALKADDLELAQTELSKALLHDPICARALIMMGDTALKASDFETANALYEQVESVRPELMPEIIAKRFEVFERAGESQKLDQYLKKIHGQLNAYSVIRSTREVIAARHNEALADRFFKDQILKRPSLKGLRDWAQDQLALSKPDERDKVQVICDLLDKVVKDKPAYRCTSCGFQGNVMHWRCPSCGRWDSVSTIIGVEGE